jgi:hypothetical protein
LIESRRNPVLYLRHETAGVSQMALTSVAWVLRYSAFGSAYAMY